jgi:hypothetical protein
MRELKKATAGRIPLSADLVLYLNGRDVLRHNGRASEASRRRIFDLFENVKRALASVAKGPNYLVGFTPSDFYKFVRKMDRLFHVFCQWLGAGISPCIDGRSLFFEISMG